MPAARDLLSTTERGLDCLGVAAGRLPWRLGGFALFALIATWPLLSTAHSLNEFRDAHVLGHYEWAAAQDVLRFGQFPLWDPYYCGGMYLLGTPQARFVSPTFLLTLLFGSHRGESLTAFAMMVVGLEGTYRYARSRGAGSLGAALAAPVFAASGIFALSPVLGWYNFFSFELLPWAAYGTRRALAGQRGGVIVAALALAWAIGFGGTYTAPMAALWCAFEVADDAVGALMRRRKKPLRALGTTGRRVGRAVLVAVLALALSTVRLWPIVDSLQAGQRVIGGTPGTAAATIFDMLLSGLKKDTENASFFIGWLALPAAVVGLARPRARSLLLVAGLSLWLAAGYSAEPSLFACLRQLPIYSLLRYPERFLIFVPLASSVLAACGLSATRRLAARARRGGLPGWASVLARTSPFLVCGLLLAGLVPLVGLHLAQAAGRDLAAPPARESRRPFHQARGNRWALAYYAPLDRGSLSCWEAYAVPQSPRLRADLAAEENLADEDAGTVAERRWSPDEIDLDVSLSRPATLEVNQNWNAGWRSNVGVVRSDHGLLVVDLPAGKHAVTLQFLPRSAEGGALVSLVALASLVAIAWSGRRRRGVGRRRDAVVVVAACAAPAAVLLACLRLSPTAGAAEFVPVDFNGDPVVADALPEGAIRLDAAFADGVTLEAATLEGASLAPGQTMVLELDWRRERVITPGLGVFVHVELSQGDGMNGDHALLSSTLALDDAPANKTLRDVMPFFIPEDASGKTVKVWVGLWRVRGDGKRSPIRDPGHAIVNDGRILASTFAL